MLISKDHAPENAMATSPEPLVCVRQREAVADLEGFWARADEIIKAA
jgi:hypothetical protein